MSVINLIKNLFHNLPVFLILICGVVLIATPAKAEERYVRPADVIGDGFKINFKEIQSEKDNSSFRVTFYNTSRNEVLSVNPHKLGFEFVGTPGANGVYYYNSKMSKISNQNFVVLPGKNKSKTIKVEGDFDHRASVIKIHIDGLKKGTLPGASIEMEPLTLSAGDDLEIPNDQLNLIIEKVSNKNGFTVKVKIEFPEYGNDNYLVSFEENKAILTNEGGDKLDLNISTMGKKTSDL